VQSGGGWFSGWFGKGNQAMAEVQAVGRFAFPHDAFVSVFIYCCCLLLTSPKRRQIETLNSRLALKQP